MPSHWTKKGPAHTLIHNTVTIAIVTEVEKSTTGAPAVEWQIMLDPADGIQRPNESMKTAGIVMGGPSAVPTAKQKVHGILGRYGFQRYIARSLDARATPAERAEKLAETLKPKPAAKKAPAKKSTTKKKGA